MPYFAHVSLILAPDRSKLSKRHGATSVGQVFVSSDTYLCLMPSPGYDVLAFWFPLHIRIFFSIAIITV